MYNYNYQKGKGIGILIFVLFTIIYFLFQLIKKYPFYFITGILIVMLIVFWFLSKKKKREESEENLKEELKRYKTEPEVKKEKKAYPYDYSHKDGYYKKRKFSKQSGTERILKKAFDRAGLDIIPQYKISKMTVDFAIPKKKIVIEVDGPHHNEIEYKKQDGRRDYILRGKGWNIWRVKVEEIDNNVDKVVDEILKRLNKKGKIF